MSTTPSEFDLQAAFPTLNEEQIELLTQFGERRTTRTGDVIYEAGQGPPSLVVVLAGRVQILDRSDGSDRTIISVGPGEFAGELGLLTGQSAYATCEVQEPGEVLVVPPSGVQTAVATIPAVSDVLVTAFSTRRQILLRVAETTLTFIGPESSQTLLQIAEFVSRNRIPYRWLAPDDPVAVDLLHRVAPGQTRDIWVIVRDQLPLVDPSPLRLAKALGLDLAIGQQEPADLIIVGAGPAGLSAAVYGASEGLRTIVVDDVAIGGQAGASSRIENYLGFPTGISGGELAFRAEVQALKFGARITVPNHAVGLRRIDNLFELELEYGKTLRARSLIVATGARYRRLGLPEDDLFAGRGLFYAATELEARLCTEDDVVVVGGGNSAGQAAMFLTGKARVVHLVHRRENLAKDMSQYLVSRLERAPNVRLHLGSSIQALHGDDHLTSVTIQDSNGGSTEQPAGAIFVMIGADPCTSWLPDSIALDSKGFVLTGLDLPPSESAIPRSPFETSEPGIFAVGDVRSGSVKRVASAVGEGSVVIQNVHRYLAATTLTNTTQP